MTIAERIERLIDLAETEKIEDSAIWNDFVTELKKILSEVKQPRRYTVIYDKLATITVRAKSMEEAMRQAEDFLENKCDQLEWTEEAIKEIELDE